MSRCVTRVPCGLMPLARFKAILLLLPLSLRGTRRTLGAQVEGKVKVRADNYEAGANECCTSLRPTLRLFPFAASPLMGEPRSLPPEFMRDRIICLRRPVPRGFRRGDAAARPVGIRAGGPARRGRPFAGPACPRRGHRQCAGFARQLCAGPRGAPLPRPPLVSGGPRRAGARLPLVWPL